MQMEKDIRVALFEDNFLLRDGYYQLINGTLGLRCVGAFDSASDLIFKIGSCKPDVVLMDIDMPGINGVKATSVIKANFPGIFVVIQTVFEDEDLIFQSIQSGANGYILKKSPPLKLLDAITEVYSGGAPMTPSIANKTLELFRKGNFPSQPREDTVLNGRQQEILECIVSGMSYKLIAEKLFISIETVKYHVKNIYNLLHVHSRFELISKRDKR